MLRDVNYRKVCAVETQELMTRAEFAARLGIAPITAAHWAMQGIGPQPIKLGPRLLRYRKSDVDAWLAEAEEKARVAALDARLAAALDTRP